MPLTQPEIHTLAQAVLAGQRLAIARTISQVEDQTPATAGLLRHLYPHTGRAQIVGITGAPGTGKSTLVNVLAQSYRRQGKSVAIVAVDPTSPFTGGALLGDRVRMRALSGDPGVFVRSMAARGSLGGLALSTSDVIHVFDAAGFERILVETVGVGQAEVEIASTAHTTLVVEAPGLGDEVQAIKAGILEIADILVVNKADRPGVDNTMRALELMLELEREARDGRGVRGKGRWAMDDGQRMETHHHNSTNLLHGFEIEEAWVSTDAPVTDMTVTDADTIAYWQVEVLKTVAANNEGVDTLVERIDAHWAWLEQSGEKAMREERRAAHTLDNIIRAELNRRIRAAMPTNDLNQQIEAIRTRQIDPHSAAQEILKRII